MGDSRYRVEDPADGDPNRQSIRVGDGSTGGLHVPSPPHRPGDEPRFTRFTQQPGDLSKPPSLVAYDQLHDHAHGLIRVLDDEGRAAGPWNPKLKPATLREALEFMLSIRHFDARMSTMQRQGRLSFYLECRGEEAVAVGAGLAFEPTDLLFPSYRQQALFPMRGMPLEDMMCHNIGNQHDNCKGRQMPVHYSWKQGNIVSISSPVGTQFPQAVGAAMAAAYQRRPQVVASWMGDGTAAQGDFHHALNFASVYLPPVILNVVNNQWAISTHRNLGTGGKTFAARAESYGIPGMRVDGNDLLAVYAATSWAVERARRGGGPTLLELLTYRGSAHSTSDDPSRYRPSDEARLWPGGDPVERLAAHLTVLGEWSEMQQQRLEERLQREMITTYKKAEIHGSLAGGPFAPAETIFDDVYQQLPPHLQEQRDGLRDDPDDQS